MHSRLHAACLPCAASSAWHAAAAAVDAAVSRVVCKSQTYDVKMRIDVATDVYPLKAGQQIRMALAQTLRLDGKPDDGTYDQSGEVRACGGSMRA